MMKIKQQISNRQDNICWRFGHNWQTLLDYKTSSANNLITSNTVGIWSDTHHLSFKQCCTNNGFVGSTISLLAHIVNKPKQNNPLSHQLHWQTTTHLAPPSRAAQSSSWAHAT